MRTGTYLVSTLGVLFCCLIQTARAQTYDTPCVYEWECSSKCCAMSYNSKNVLGYYCLGENDCNGSGLGVGQSCNGPDNCSTKCCEDTICQSKQYCFEKYILPFVVIFSIVAAFIICALIVFLIFWYKRRKAEKKREKEIEMQNETDKEEDAKLSNKSDMAKGPNETTAMGLKGEKENPMNGPLRKDSEEIMDDDKEDLKEECKETEQHFSKNVGSIEEDSDEEEKVELP
ncbi:unnamed protein product [Moneuplotes crassus]|uniref:Uncharacterized protein n=1 Tax=Euplotes crassus TaxID=5936 RepID=A0AAD2D5D4_EUPCR|nr:unnamed protein product [Moneuplotes crassus]